MSNLDLIPDNSSLQDFDTTRRGRNREQAGQKTKKIRMQTVLFNFEMSQGWETTQIDRDTSQHVFWFNLSWVSNSRNAQPTWDLPEHWSTVSSSFLRVCKARSMTSHAWLKLEALQKKTLRWRFFKRVKHFAIDTALESFEPRISTTSQSTSKDSRCNRCELDISSLEFMWSNWNNR